MKFGSAQLAICFSTWRYRVRVRIRIRASIRLRVRGLLGHVSFQLGRVVELVDGLVRVGEWLG